jgi:hypothetical protein
MLTPITNVTPAPAADQPKPTQSAAQPAPKAKSQPAPTDTVTLSAAASTRQELTETSAQTAKEASHGDIQAKRLLAKEAADSKSGL